MLRHPLVLVGLLIVVAGAELAAFNATIDADPATVRFVVVGSCLLLILIWFLARVSPTATAPVWPSRHAPVPVVAVDADTRRLEALVTPDAPPSYSGQLADLIASLVPPGASVSPALGRYVAAARAGKAPRRPSPTTLSAWLTELEQLR